MLKWLEQHWFKAGILTVILIAILLIAYYFMVFTPGQQEKIIQAQEQAQQAAQIQENAQKNELKSELSSCLSAANDSYSSNWASQCDQDYQSCINTGLSENYCKQTWNPGGLYYCQLPAAQADEQNTALQSAKDDCFKQYPQN